MAKQQKVKPAINAYNTAKSPLIKATVIAIWIYIAVYACSVTVEAVQGSIKASDWILSILMYGAACLIPSSVKRNGELGRIGFVILMLLGWSYLLGFSGNKVTNPVGFYSQLAMLPVSLFILWGMFHKDVQQVVESIRFRFSKE